MLLFGWRRPTRGMRGGLPVLLAVMVVILTTLASCGGTPSVPGRWQATNNAEAGFEIKANGTFEGELGPSGERRARLNGKWVAKGTEVTFTLEAGPLQGPGPLVGKIDGNTMTLTSTGQGPGNVTLKRRAR